MFVCVHVCTLSCSVMSDSWQPHGLQPTRLLCPWNFPGKNTGVICHFLHQGKESSGRQVYICIPFFSVLLVFGPLGPSILSSPFSSEVSCGKKKTNKCPVLRSVYCYEVGVAGKCCFIGLQADFRILNFSRKSSTW